jgi:DNA-binding transcriptional MerR regulator
MLASALFTTGDVAKRLEVAPETIRLWERLGVIRAAVRTAGGMRLFDEDEILRVGRERDSKRTATSPA